VKDPEEGWVNAGTYRCMLYGTDEKDKIFVSPRPTHHGRIIIDKYHARGQSCPVAVCLGQEPSLWMASTYSGVAWGTSEFDFAGWLQGSPMEVVQGEITGLPIPATAEIVLEGEIPPVRETRPEGPFGEWLGYVTEPKHRKAPVMTVKAILYRDNPVILGAPPLKPPAPYSFALPLAAIAVWDQMEAAGVPGIKGVWIPVFDNSRAIVIAIKQMYPGHAKQVALAAAGCHAGSTGGARFIIIVDDDVDITNLGEVFWAVATRCDADTIDIVKGLPVSGSDPLNTFEDTARWGYIKSRVIMDACRPYMRIKDFPPVNVFSAAYREKMKNKWRHLLDI
ncbi:MAG: UbiD family decarboxylase, partial [Chloroflexi bacterium]|nr:UbiD family decarboxylase [Chloroflexota bacterium]